MPIEIRPQKVEDAERFFEILSSPNFKFFRHCPKDVEAEREFIRGNEKKMADNLEHNYTILFDGKVVGGVGMKIDQHRKYIGEIGYFVDEKFWGKGVATEAVRLMEKIGFEKMGLRRIEIIMNPENVGSEMVAKKCGYAKEGTMKKVIKEGEEYYDAHLYAKLK